MNKPTLTSTFLLICFALALTNCNTILRGSHQKIELYTNTDSAFLKLDTTVLIKKKHILKLPRAMASVFEIQKEGYESQKIKLTETSSYFPTNFSLGLTTATGILLSNNQTHSSGLATTAFLGIWLIGGSIDIASGSHYKYHPELVQVNLYPSLKKWNYPNLSINCNSVSIPESKFIGPIGTRVFYIQGQSTPIYLSDFKTIKSTTVKDIINEYLSGLGCEVIGKKFNSDSISKFSIDAIIDSLVINDEQIKANDKIEMNKNTTTGEVIHDYSERYVYTHLAVKIHWQLTNNYNGQKITKTILTDINYYSESEAQVFNKHIRTNFNQFLNDKDVNQLLND